MERKVEVRWSQNPSNLRNKCQKLTSLRNETIEYEANRGVYAKLNERGMNIGTLCVKLNKRFKTG